VTYRDNAYEKEGHFRLTLLEMRNGLRDLEPFISSTRSGQGFAALEALAHKIDAAIEAMPRETNTIEELFRARSEHTAMRAERDHLQAVIVLKEDDLRSLRRHYGRMASRLRVRRWTLFAACVSGAVVGAILTAFFLGGAS
jgi:hypothetical protein